MATGKASLPTRKPVKFTLARVYRAEKNRERYLELVRLFPLRPLKSEADLDDATKMIHSIIDHISEDELTPAESDYIDVLSDLVEAYETVHYPDDPVSDADMLRYLIELKEVTQAEVAKGAGIAVSTVSEVLSGKRKLNRAQIGKLARFFKVEPGVFSFGE